MPVALTIEQQLLERALAERSSLRWAPLNPILEAARSSYFALYRSRAGDPGTAVSNEFRQLVDSLGVNARPTRREYVGRVRGKIDWAATIRARSTDQQNPLRFVCREAERETNTPQNQLLVFVLGRVSEALAQIPSALRSGHVRSGLGIEDDHLITIGRQADAMSAAIRSLLVHPRLRGVADPPTIEQLHLDAAHRAGHPGYDSAAALYEQWHRVVERPSRAALVEIGRHSILLPADGAPDAPAWVDLAALLLVGRHD